jgi:UDP-2,4-diacetamido-2,4,6-trideoxy-beta-L-altropyranose hydrolase
MRVAIRTDASSRIGSGHVMRCKTLAEELRSRGAEVRFICREHPGNLIQLLRSSGHLVSVLPASKASRIARREHAHDYALWLGVAHSEDAARTLEALGDFTPDWLVVDHYGFDAAWERLLRPHVGGILVIDDLANREHDCDLLLDQNLHADMSERYAGLTPAHAMLLLGPKFVLLRPEFQKARATLRARDGSVRRILVFFGGVDSTRQTEKVLAIIGQLRRPEITWDVVVGAQNPRAKAIELLCREISNTNFHCQITNMAELMVYADLAVGAGGSASWERCALGLPAILLSTADNQRETTAALEQAGAVWHLGKPSDVTAAMLTEAIRHAFSEPEMLRRMSRAAYNVLGGASVFGVQALLDAITAGMSKINVRVT